MLGLKGIKLMTGGEAATGSLRRGSQIGAAVRVKGNGMKSLTSKLLVVVAAGMMSVSATSVFGQGQIINLDEMGNGYITPVLPFPYTISEEPLSHIATLRYDLPFAGVAGDVLLQESVGGPLSDIVRFDGQFHVYFFSDGSEGITSLADVPVLPSPITPNLTFLEQGQEGGLQYIYYTPAAGEPGYKNLAPGTTYYIVSDIPEPSATMMLGCMGGGLLLLLALRRQAKRT